MYVNLLCGSIIKNGKRQLLFITLGYLRYFLLNKQNFSFIHRNVPMILCSMTLLRISSTQVSLLT